MNKKVVKPIVLVLIFIGAIITFSSFTNKEKMEMTTTMEEATLPVIHFVYNNTPINELHGYVNAMDFGTMRDAVTPIGKDYLLNMEIEIYEKEVDTVAYEIRSVEDNRLLMDNDDVSCRIEGEKIVCDVSLSSLLEKGEEYNMVICLTSKGEQIYYYTRLMQVDGYYVEDSLAFALQFHEYTFRDDADTFIPTYMDPATGDATTLSYVDLSCTLRQMTWADFDGMPLTEPMAYIEEVNDSYNVIVLNYVMTNVNEYHEVEYYNVEEYYRLRKAPNRMYVLNFERRMNQVFRVDNSFIQNDSAILLGIRNPEVEYMSGGSGDSIAFVQEGELWIYNRVEHMISQVFSFRSLEGIDGTENWNQHDIKIVKVDEVGSVDFVVYGYMNRGLHEGQVGIGVYHYDGIAHTVEEEIFISSTKSYDALKAELGELFYVNEQKILHLMMNETVYKIDLTTYEIAKKLENLSENEYAISESNRIVAWIKHDDNHGSSVIYLEDLKTGITYEVKDEEGTYLQPMQFLGEDFIYGIAKAEDVKLDAAGSLVFPISYIKIIDTYENKEEVIKTYKPLNGFVKEISVENDNIYVTLMAEQNGIYVKSGEDIIMNRETGDSSEVELSAIVTEKKQTQMLLTMKKITATDPIKTNIAQQVRTEAEQEEITLDSFTETVYYVYARGESLLASKDVSEAILVANENLGVVVNQNREYIWKRARSTNKSALGSFSYHQADVSCDSVTKCLSAILMREGTGVSVKELIEGGMKPKEVLQSTLPDSKVLELKGCTSDELLYFIHKGTPVMAYIENGNAVLLTGYSSSQIFYYDPATGVHGVWEIPEAEQRFLLGGLKYIAYIK